MVVSTTDSAGVRFATFLSAGGRLRVRKGGGRVAPAHLADVKGALSKRESRKR